MARELGAAAVRAALDERREGEALAEDARACTECLFYFVQRAWSVVEPGTQFISNWHLEVVCELLEAASRGEIRRLLINIPPRHMKSLAVSVFWPVWIWTSAPHVRFLTSSYGSSLAERDATKSRDLLRSQWFRRRWPDIELKSDVNRLNRYENTKTGYRIATGIGGEATGEGGDILIVDDPHKLEEAVSDKARARVIDWHDGTLATRFNDPSTGVEVVVMQRLHEGDLAGHLLERGGWTHLCLPARYELHHPFVCPYDPRQAEGEPLWPERIPEPELAEIERTMGSFRAAGQLQQRPAPVQGELLRRTWWSFYNPALLHEDRVQELPRFERIVGSWDTAFQDKTTSDYVVGQVWGVAGPDRYLLYSFRGHANLRATKEAMRAAREFVRRRWPRIGYTILIEKSANGYEIIFDLRREIPGVIPVSVSQDKSTRAIAASVPLESGNVYVPGRAAPDMPSGYEAPAWVASLIEEAAMFPSGKHDDQVDAFSQAMIWIQTKVRRPATTSVPQGQIPPNPYARGLVDPFDRHPSLRTIPRRSADNLSGRLTDTELAIRLGVFRNG